MRFSRVQIYLALTNSLCAYQMSNLETRTGLKMASQILDDTGRTKMVRKSLKIKTFKNPEV